MADDNTGTIIEPTTNGQDNSTTGLSSDPNVGQDVAADQTGPTISVGNDVSSPTDAPTQGSPFPEPTPAPIPEPTTAPISTPADSDDKTAPSAANQKLLELKQTALQELSPLVDELDLGPEEEFETLLMMIQSGDNEDLIPRAHEAATKIQDKKERAEALLEIVNEINYFTQK